MDESPFRSYGFCCPAAFSPDDISYSMFQDIALMTTICTDRTAFFGFVDTLFQRKSNLPPIHKIIL